MVLSWWSFQKNVSRETFLVQENKTRIIFIFRSSRPFDFDQGGLRDCTPGSEILVRLNCLAGSSGEAAPPARVRDQIPDALRVYSLALQGRG